VTLTTNRGIGEITNPYANHRQLPGSGAGRAIASFRDRDHFTFAASPPRNGKSPMEGQSMDSDHG
jgi:hypothetical protein